MSWKMRQNIFRNFETKMDPYIPTRRPDILWIVWRRKDFELEDFAVLADHKVKLKGREKKTK